MKNLVAKIVLTVLVGLATTTKVVAADAPVSDMSAKMTLTASPKPDNRAAILRDFLTSYRSPLASQAKVFVAEADKNQLDWKLVAAIAGVESTFGQQIPTDSYNAWGWGVFTGATDGVHFRDWADGISQVSNGLRSNYFDRGAKDLYEVGWIYAANGNSWANHVTFFLDKIDTFAANDPGLLAVQI